MAIPELETLYNTYKTPLYRYLLHLCRDPHRAEDLLADTFLRALGYAYTEIADRLKITENSARVMEHRTRTWLKSTLQKEGLWND